MRSIGWGTVLPYFMVFYVLPITIMFVIGPHQNFTNPGNSLLLLFTVCAVLLFIKIFSRFHLSLPLNIFSRLPNIYRSKFFLTLTFCATLPLALVFSTTYGIGFRYSGEAISDSGPLAVVATIYRPFFSSLVLYYFLLMVSGAYISKTQRALISVHLVNWILFANGAVDIMWAMMALMIAFSGNSARRYLVSGNKINLKNLLKTVTIVLMSGLAVSGIVFLGFANKLGVEAAVIVFTEEFADRVLYYLYYRLAVFSSSLDLVLDRGLDFDLYSSVIENELENMAYRIGIIFQIPVERPDIEGMNRLNYLLLFNDPSASRAGASPGPIASFAYLPMLPFNLILASAYIAAVLNTYSRILKVSPQERLTIFAMLFFIIVNFTFFHNPIAAFTKIGPEMFRTAIYLLAMSLALRQCQRFRRRGLRRG